jgi:hypothetical protein
MLKIIFIEFKAYLHKSNGERFTCVIATRTAVHSSHVSTACLPHRNDFRTACIRILDAARIMISLAPLVP